jgi:hypothetical protein
MKKRIDDLVARLQQPLQNGGRHMWYLLFTDTLLDLLEQGDTVTREALHNELARRRALYDAAIPGEALLRDALEEAIVQLRLHAPKG